MKMSGSFNPLERGHTCIVTNDLEKLRRNWKDYLGIQMTPNFTMEGPCVVRGKDLGRCKVFIAFADLGDLRIEFIQPVEGESQEWEFIRKHGNGIHHVDPNFPRLKTLDERIKQWESRGVKVLQVDAKNRWAYMDTEQLLGAVIELH